MQLIFICLELIEAGQDGTLWVYDSKGPYLKPTFVTIFNTLYNLKTMDKAHLPGSGASGLVFNSDNMITTRGIDDTVKLFDLRNFKKPLATHTAMNLFEETNLTYSPDEQYIVTGVSIKKGDTKGIVQMLNAKDLSVVKEVEIGSSSIVSVAWHGKINQILCGAADGVMHCMYNPTSSVRGGVQTVGKKKKEMTVDDLEFSRFFTSSTL